jgi:hypothetical protein
LGVGINFFNSKFLYDEIILIQLENIMKTVLAITVLISMLMGFTAEDNHASVREAVVISK